MAVTASPSWRSDAVTSEPMKPSPITTARRPRLGSGADPIAVLDRAELEDAGEIRAGGRERPVAPACRDQEPVVRDLFAVVKADDLPRGIDPGGAGPEPEADRLVGVVARRLDELVLEPLLTAEVALRQGRAVVRQARLRADEQDLALEAGLPQGGRRTGSRQRGADDDEALFQHGVPIIDELCPARPGDRLLPEASTGPWTR